MTQSEAATANHDLAAQLRESRLKPGIKHFIGGQWVDSIDGDTFDVLNPVTNEPYITAASGKKADIEAAVASAAANGAEIAMGPTPMPSGELFAVYLQAGVQQGFWQR